MKDFYHLVKECVENSPIDELLFADLFGDGEQNPMQIFLEAWNADPNIRLEISETPMVIAASAFNAALSDTDSLEYIFWCASILKREVPFCGIIDENAMRIAAFFRGVTGTSGRCDWEAGPLLERSYVRAREHDHTVMLGHTHPPHYGAVCSNVRLGMNKNNPGPYKDDYWEMRARMTTYPNAELVSRFHIIMSPIHDQIGIFELKENGVVVYHPWEVENK